MQGKKILQLINFHKNTEPFNKTQFMNHYNKDSETINREARKPWKTLTKTLKMSVLDHTACHFPFFFLKEKRKNNDRIFFKVEEQNNFHLKILTGTDYRRLRKQTDSQKKKLLLPVSFNKRWNFNTPRYKIITIDAIASCNETAHCFCVKAGISHSPKTQPTPSMQNFMSKTCKTMNECIHERLTGRKI